MKRAFLHALAGAVVAACPATLTLAQSTVLAGDHAIDGRACIGPFCDGSTSFPPVEALKLNGYTVGIGFEDASDGTGFPDRDWRLLVNDDISTATGGISRFSVEDIDASTIPFTIEGGAPENAFYMADDGDIGLGTSMPQASLHVASQTFPTLRLERTSPPTSEWNIAASPGTLRIRDVETWTVPFSIVTGAPTNALTIADSGNIGIGTSEAAAPLEVSGDATFSFFRITAAQAAINQSVDITFTGGPLGTGELRYNIVDGDGPEMKLNADGDMQILGTLTTGGPSCTGGCDAVFTEERIIPEADYAARMWADGYLPHVGPTAPETPVNVSEKLGGILNALEHAHVFIDRQNRRIETLESEKAAQYDRIAAQDARIEALLARMEAIETGQRAD